MALTVTKFGGSSLASASQMRKVRAILDADVDRRVIVPSAPGKRRADDVKVTDLLYRCHAHAAAGEPIDNVFYAVTERFQGIAAELAVQDAVGLDAELDKVKATILEVAASASASTSGGGGGPDYAASRGEYLNGLILAAYLGAAFIDPADCIFFTERGRLDEARTYPALAERLAGVGRAVVPGFYGSDAEGNIKTFSRGGSDVTGAIVARAVKARVYENWTDVSGLLMTDPRVVENPKTIAKITYRELRELSYSGATVLHDEAVFPVRAAGIPVHIRNTNAPDDPGTLIVAEDDQPRTGQITGIAGRKEFTIINVEKAMMNSELGYGRRVLEVLEKHGISFEHMPSGIDTLGVVVSDAVLDGKLEAVLADIDTTCEPDRVDVDADLALIATVGRGMAHTPGMSAKLFSALAKANVNVRMIDQGSSELNIIIGVGTKDYETAVRAIYEAFVG